MPKPIDALPLELPHELDSDGVQLSLFDLKVGSARYNVNAFIRSNPTEVGLVPNKATPTAKPSGGHDYNWDQTAEAKPLQTFRLVGRTEPPTEESSSNGNGFLKKLAYTLVGEWDADVSVGDSWDADGVHYVVDLVYPRNGWETRAWVTAFAEVVT